MFVELDLDSTKYKSKMARLQGEARTTSLSLEDNFRILGGASDRMYTAMVARANNAYNMIAASAKKGSMDEVRARQLHATEMKRISDEMTGKIVANQNKVSLGWVTMIKGAIVFRAAMAGIHLAWESTFGSFGKGIESINQMELAAASLASAFATNDPSLPFEKAYAIAGGIVEKIQEMDRAFVGTASELQTLVDAWATYGGAVNFATEKTRDEFVVFANIIKLMTRGQAFERQAMQETRALMEGKNIQGALLLKKLLVMEPKVQALIPLWREQGTLITNINRLMSGYVEGSVEIEKTLEAQRSSLETITFKILREGMGPAYQDILGFVKTINDYLLDENGLTEEAVRLAEKLKSLWQGTKNVMLAVAAAALMVVKAFKVAGIAIGGYASVIADALSGKFIDYSVWGDITKEVDDLTASLKKLSEAADPKEGKGWGTDIPLKTKGAKGPQGGDDKVDKAALAEAARWHMEYLTHLVESYDDNYGTVEARAEEFAKHMVQVNKEMIEELSKDIASPDDLMPSPTDAAIEFDLSEMKRKEELMDLERKHAKERQDLIKENFALLSDVADKAMGLYEKDSKAYKAFDTMKKSVLMAQLAYTAAANLALIMGNEAVAISGAAASVAQAGQAPPPLGFAFAAQMLAFMASVLGMAGIAFGGGGGGGGGSPPVLPPSTVLGGAPGEDSKSLANALEMLVEVDLLQFRELRKIHDVMVDLNDSIGDLIADIFKVGGLGTFNEWSSTLQYGGLTSAGIEVSTASIGGLQGDQTVTAREYADWSANRGGSTGTEYAELDRRIILSINALYKNIGDAMLEAGKILLDDTGAILNYIFEGSKIELSGTAEEMEEQFNAFFSSIADDAAKALFTEFVAVSYTHLTLPTTPYV